MIFQRNDFPVVFEGSPDLRIIVLAYNRSESLKRLLHSLSVAYYLGDKIALDIWIDRSAADGKVCDKTFKTGMNFKFKYGEKAVYVHKTHMGVMKQWLGNWNYKAHPEEICVFLEDDLVVSPHFYRWLKSVHKTYDSDDRISGYTLQGAGTIHSGEKSLNNIIVPDKHSTYLYSMPGTWGFSPKREQWEKFITWYEEKSTKTHFHPIISDDIATDWYNENKKRGSLENMWSIWYIYYNYIFKKYVLYPNIQPDFQGFSFNWKEPGVNSYGHSLKPESGTLIVNWSDKYESLPTKPPIVSTNGTVVIG